jgi:hypothetical protein
MPERDFIEKQQRRMNGAAGGLAHSSVGANPPGPLPGRGPRVGSRENQSVGAKARQKVTNRMADWRRQNGDIRDPGDYGLAAPTRSIGSSPGPEPPPPRDSEVNTGANRNQTARNALGAPFGQDDVQQEEFLGLDPRIHGNKGQAPAPQAPQAPQAPPQVQAPPAPPAQPGQADVQGAAPPQAPVPPPQPPQGKQPRRFNQSNHRHQSKLSSLLNRYFPRLRHRITTLRYSNWKRRRSLQTERFRQGALLERASHKLLLLLTLGNQYRDLQGVLRALTR